jgi:hypothetical protein
MHEPALYANIWKFIGRSLSGIAPAYSGRVYYQAAPVSTTFPVLVYQPIVNQSYAHLMLNDSYWQGMVVFRSIAQSFTEAQELLTTVANTLSNNIALVSVSGVSIPYSVRYDICEVPSFPVEKLSDGYIYTAAITMDTYIFPTDY